MSFLLQQFSSDFDFIIKRVFLDKTPTAFSRYNEWEYWLISGRWFVWAWWFWKTYQTKRSLCDDLRECMKTEDPNYFYWIASKQHPDANSFYKTNIPSNNKTFATLFVNNNWKRRREILHNIPESVVLIANAIGKNNTYPFKIEEYISIPFDVVDYYEQKKEEVLNTCRYIAKTYNNQLVFFCAWPLSNLMIDYCRHLNDTNRYIDIWSTLDEYVMKRKTRRYFQETWPTFNKIDAY